MLSGTSRLTNRVGLINMTSALLSTGGMTGRQSWYKAHLSSLALHRHALRLYAAARNSARKEGCSDELDEGTTVKYNDLTFIQW